MSKQNKTHLSFVSNDLVGAQTVTDEIFPADGEEGAELDGVVTRIDLDLVDDYPASDPRWAESVPDGEEGEREGENVCPPSLQIPDRNPEVELKAGWCNISL